MRGRIRDEQTENSKARSGRLTDGHIDRDRPLDRDGINERERTISWGLRMQRRGN